MISCTRCEDTLTIQYQGIPILEHSPKNSCLSVRKAKEQVDMYRGNFFIEDSVLEEQDFPECTVHQAYQDGRGVVNLTFKGNAGTVACDLSEVEGRLQIHVSTLPKPYNRLIIRLVAREDEHV